MQLLFLCTSQYFSSQVGCCAKLLVRESTEFYWPFLKNLYLHCFLFNQWCPCNQSHCWPYPALQAIGGGWDDLKAMARLSMDAWMHGCMDAWMHGWCAWIDAGWMDNLGIEIWSMMTYSIPGTQQSR
jgi:hypothetical protein